MGGVGQLTRNKEVFDKYGFQGAMNENSGARKFHHRLLKGR